MRRGFSLLGLLMAVTAASFLILPLFLSFQTSRRGATRNLYAIQAASLATAQIERLERLTYRRLEAIQLGQADLAQARDPEAVWPDVISGPFEARPQRPDLIEEAITRQGRIQFDRHTYLSYFPDPEPDPDALDFVEKRRRMRIRVVVLWDEPTGNGDTRPRSFELSTMVHDEGYNPKPSLRSLLTP